AGTPCGGFEARLNFAWISVQDSGTKEQDEPRKRPAVPAVSACFTSAATRARFGDDRRAINGLPAMAMRGDGRRWEGDVQYAFEDYVIDPDRRELTRSAEPVAVGPQVFDLLLHLVRNREHVVSKDELLDAVWAGRIVSESTLASHINAARKAIGDSG